MFNLISKSALSDLLAPPVSSVEEFIFQWNSFSSFFQQHTKINVNNNNNHHNNRNKSVIESTNLPNKLIKMADIIVREQSDLNLRKKDPSSLCASLEFLLQNNIPETLSIVAQADTPVGICPQIMLFMLRILNDTKVTLIPYKSVHSALNKIIVICGKIQASPYETVEAYFINSLVKLIVKNPEFLHFFSANSFPLINSLLLLLYSEDSKISQQSGDSILRLMQIVDHQTAKIMVEETPFCCKIINQIINRFNEIPHSLKPEEIEIVNGSLLEDLQSGSKLSNPVRKFLCFLKWYIFFDILINNLPEESILATNLIDEFKSTFLESSLLPELTGDGFHNELDAIDNVIWATVLTSNCLRNSESSRLIDLICHFLTIPDSEEHHNKTHHFNNHKLTEILLKRCHLSKIVDDFTNQDEQSQFIKLASATLQLFEDILCKPSFQVIDHLIIQHLLNKNYLNTCPQRSNQNALETNVSKYVSSKFDSLFALDLMNSVADQIKNLPNIHLACQVDNEHLKQMLYLFISLIPNELKGDQQNEKAEYEVYLIETIKGFQYFMMNCFNKWPMSIEPTSELKEEKNQPHMVEKPIFLEIILDNLISFLELPYNINLQMFSILAKISLIPNQLINDYLLDPTVCLKEGHHNLFSILHKLVEHLQISVKGIEQLQEKLMKTKLKLLGKDVHEEIDDENNLKILQSLIVLDEFCKELSSIVYAKNFTLKLCNDLMFQ